MNDKRFVGILNETAASFALIWDTDAARRRDPASIAAWAGFLTRCVAQGVTVADPRWKDLEVHVRNGRPCFALPSKRPSAPPDPPDMSIGLALLMSLLERDRERR